LENGSVDLITVMLAFHWLDRVRFLGEARRVLREHGTLVIVSHGFHFRMKENPEFIRWAEEIYFPRNPTPPRNNQPFTGEVARDSGFAFAGRETYVDELLLSPEQLVRNLLTHSNVILRVEERGESLEEVFQQTLDSVRPFFPAPTGTFSFGGEIWYLQPSVLPSPISLS
jgi:SAM-dependent methyltransferase